MAAQSAPHIEIWEGPQAAGKTTGLLERVAGLLDGGADPTGLLVVCAGKDAAASFKRRLGFRVAAGPESVEPLRAMSARALSYEVLAQPEAVALFGHGPRVMLDVERSILLADLRREGLGKEELAQGCRELYRAWDCGADCPEPDAAARRYVEALHAYGAYDVRELGARALRAVAEVPALAQRLGAARVLVDDANLIGPAQLRLLEALAGEELLLAGDCGVANPFFDAAATGSSLARFAKEHGVEPRRLQAAPLAFPEGSTFVVKSPEYLTEAVTCAKSVRHILDTVAVDLSQDYELTDAAPEGDAQAAGLHDAHGEPVRFDDLVYPNEVCVVIPHGGMLKDVCQKLKAAGVASVTCTEGQPVGGDPRHIASVATLQSFTLLGLAADPADLLCWRVWCGLGRADIGCAAWQGLEAYAKQKGVAVLDALTGLAGLTGEPFEGAGLLAKRYGQAAGLIAKARRRRGRQLIDVVSPNENLTFSRLCEPIVAQDAATFFFAANLGAVDRGFGGRLWDVRVGVPQAFSGLPTKACLFLGLNDGVAPRADKDVAPARHENECRIWRGLFAKAWAWVQMSYVQGASPDRAQAFGARVHRVRKANAGDVAVLGPSELLRELGMAAPSTMGAQQFVWNVLGDSL